MAANVLSGSTLSKAELLKLASDMEGHPDNVAPALLGGMVISIKDKEEIYYDKMKLYDSLKFCVLIPDFKLSTKEARAVLPQNISYSDGVFNAGRACLMVAALTNGSKDLLRLASQDRLHQPYRGRLIPHFNEIVDNAYSCGALGAFLSGAGPSIMVILDGEDRKFTGPMEEFLGNLKDKWILRELRPDYEGVALRQNL